ncbi:hypothetical protein BBJ28_00024767 [Nothophytophthora sp. Chile5]|nr:hypothetical protein BBJ28_00024767 [Nothophytophthora sp. Chile5]
MAEPCGVSKLPLSSTEAMATPGRWRPRILRLLLLGSTLYALLVLGWSVHKMHATAGSFELSSMMQTVQRPVANALRHVKDTVEELQRTPSPADLEAERHARSVRPLPSDETQQRNLSCIGWRATAECRPDGPRILKNDQACDQEIPYGDAGYCEVEDVASGERFRVMRRTCARSKKRAVFRCSDAPQFARFRVEARDAVEKALAPAFALPHIDHSEAQEGIVMVVYPKLVPSAFATIRALRELLGCRLPIEIWFRQDEIQRVPRALRPLEQLAANDTMGSLVFREINDSQAVHFGAKVHAIYHSFFERVLFLDADNVPVRDPSFLFKTPEFLSTGAVFWPDYWQPKHTLFHLHGESLVWELLDMPFVDMFEQESGQLVIDRRRHAAPLELVHFFTFHQPNLFNHLKLVWGDKDLFRLAWIKLDVPFHMIQTLPAVAGKVVDGSFCGMTMVQHDTEGNVLFLHRNAKKLTGEVRYGPVNYRVEAIKRARSKLKKQGIDALPSEQAVQEELALMVKTPAPTLDPAEPDGIADAIIWTHLVSFLQTSPRSQYRIRSYSAAPQFPEGQRCYGERELGRNKHFYTQSFADLSFSGLETHLRRFAMEAVQLRQG